MSCVRAYCRLCDRSGQPNDSKAAPCLNYKLALSCEIRSLWGFTIQLIAEVLPVRDLAEECRSPGLQCVAIIRRRPIDALLLQALAMGEFGTEGTFTQCRHACEAYMLLPGQEQDPSRRFYKRRGPRPHRTSTASFAIRRLGKRSEGSSAFATLVGAQQPADFILLGEVQWCGTCRVSGICICATLQQKPGKLSVPEFHCQVERRLAIIVPVVHIAFPHQ